jgi:hypothetical protein
MKAIVTAFLILLHNFRGETLMIKNMEHGRAENKTQ